MISDFNTDSVAELGAEGLSGLALAFIYSGARLLLVPQWSFESNSAAGFTTRKFDAMSVDSSFGCFLTHTRSIGYYLQSLYHWKSQNSDQWCKQYQKLYAKRIRFCLFHSLEIQFEPFSEK